MTLWPPIPKVSATAELEQTQRQILRRSTASYVQCLTCGRNWRYGCAECADLFADYHAAEFSHRTKVRLAGDYD